MADLGGEGGGVESGEEVGVDSGKGKKRKVMLVKYLAGGPGGSGKRRRG